MIGNIPTDLQGHFLRVGPNPVHVFSEEAYHTFDGDGMIHSIEFRDGKARYRNRFIQNEGFKLEQERGDWDKGMKSLMDPTPSRIPEALRVKNLAGCRVPQQHAVCLTSPLRRLSACPIWTEGQADFDGKLTHPFTAHPKSIKKAGK